MEHDPAPSTVPQPVPMENASHKRSTSRLSLVFSALAIAFLVLIPVARSAIEDIDRQYANFGGIACGLAALLFAQLAIATHRSTPWPLRIAVFVTPVLAVAGFFAVFEFAGFNGEVWPTFRPRGTFARSQSNLRPTPPTQDAPAINPSTRSFRYSQFLGNSRNGIVEAPEFSMEWSKREPEVVWRKEIGPGWSGVAIGNGLAVTIFQREENEIVEAWSLQSGQSAWAYAIPGRHFHAMGGLGPRSTPTIASIDGRDKVLVQSSLGVVVCLDLENGELLWRFDLLDRAGINQEESEAEIMWGRSGSPLVVDDRVIIPFGGAKAKSGKVHSLIALDIATGQERWVGGDSQISYASPALLTLDGHQQIVSVNEGNVTGHDLSTGAVLWESSWPSKSNGDACASQPVQVDSNRILLGKGYALGSKVIHVNGSPKTSAGSDSASSKSLAVEAPEWKISDVWSNTRILKTKFTNAIVYDGQAYALSDGVLECVDPQTGKRQWRGARYGQGQILIVNGRILVSSEDGRVISVNRADGKAIAEMQVLDGITWNTPAVAGPYLIVRNATQAVCLTSPSQ
jgi:outer membrane protein assembly factor BamB